MKKENKKKIKYCQFCGKENFNNQQKTIWGKFTLCKDCQAIYELIERRYKKIECLIIETKEKIKEKLLQVMMTMRKEKIEE